MGVCYCSMFCCTVLCVRSSIAIILMGKRELVALLNLSSWCLVMVDRLFLAVPRGCLQFVIVVFPDHTHLLFLFQQTRICWASVKHLADEQPSCTRFFYLFVKIEHEVQLHTQELYIFLTGNINTSQSEMFQRAYLGNKFSPRAGACPPSML